LNQTSKYVLSYAIYCIGIDFIDRNTSLLQKQTGFYSKAERFPYFDAWTLTHIAWGVVAKRMKVEQPTYLTLSILNEVVLEQLICRYAESNPIIHFSKRCDSIPHMMADVIYGWLGFKLTP
jgi:hypothetical protein